MAASLPARDDKNNMTKEKLIEELKRLTTDSDIEANHVIADQLLLDYINDQEISKAYDSVEKYYA